MRVLDVCAHDSARAGRRITAIWLLEGTYSGYAVYGPTTGLPVQIIGASQFLVEDGSIHREYRVYDELALRVQIEQLRATAPAVIVPLKMAATRTSLVRVAALSEITRSSGASADPRCKSDRRARRIPSD